MDVPFKFSNATFPVYNLSNYLLTVVVFNGMTQSPLCVRWNMKQYLIEKGILPKRDQTKTYKLLTP